jgi:hypothetical protein
MAYNQTQDAPHNPEDVGKFILGLRRDADTTPVDTDGDYHSLLFDNAGNLKVNIKAGSASGTEFNEDSPHTTGDAGTLALVVRNDGGGAISGTDGDYTALTVNSSGALYVTGGGGGTEYTEDDVSASPQVGTATMMERDDQLANVTPAEADWIGLRGSAKGALWVTIPDASGDPITSFGGGTQYTEDDAVPTNPIGTAMLMERDDILGGLTPAAGDWTHPFASAEGALWVQDFNSDAILADTASMDTNLGTIASSIYVDDGDWTATSSTHALIGGVYTSSKRTITDGDTAPISLDVNGHLINNAHAEAVALSDDVSNTMNLLVDESGAFVGHASINYVYDGSTWDRMPGTSAAGLLVNLGGNNDVTVAGVATAANQLADGHNVTVDNAAGGSAVNIQDGGNSITIDGSVTADLGANNDVTCTGAVAEGAAYSENPVPIGVEARSTNPTAVDDGDIVSLKSDDYGRPIVVLNNSRDLTGTQATTITSTSETTIVTATASVFHDLTMLIFSNTSNTSTEVDLRDDTAGTVIMTVGLAAKGSAVIPFNTPLAQGAVNDNWTAQLGTAVTSVEVFAHYVTNA